MAEKEEKRGAHLRVPDHLKVAKKEYVPTGNPRGRKLGQTSTKVTMAQKKEKLKLALAKQKEDYVPTGNPQGRPKGSVKPDHLKKPKKETVPGRGRGRPKKDSE
eukprot:GFUD01129906.1.p1 GENE.GFUD01129906.1~~GFUD01129906.1.p1  ORF type:complete len:104 (+),score=40.71 GFUD01129906.1:115-426(+)